MRCYRILYQPFQWWPRWYPCFALGRHRGWDYPQWTYMNNIRWGYWLWQWERK